MLYIICLICNENIYVVFLEDGDVQTYFLRGCSDFLLIYFARLTVFQQVVFPQISNCSYKAKIVYVNY